MSKRRLRYLVEEKIVDGWDDPRLPTLSGLRRRGFTPASVRSFCERIGVSKVNSTVDYAFLEHCLREDLNSTAQRVMAVIDPIRLIIDNYPEGKSETFEIENNPESPEDGTRTVTFSRELWIERDDFREEKFKGYFRLFPGQEVRLKTAYVIRCTGCDKDEQGQITAVHAEYDPATRGGNTPDGRRIKGTIHWVDTLNAIPAEVRLYDNLFSAADPDDSESQFIEHLNPESLTVRTGCQVEASLAGLTPPKAFQFLRLGYFCLDSKDSRPDQLVFNRSVSLRDSWSRSQK
jgi:glutaminyl-tRNA synthetase